MKKILFLLFASLCLFCYADPDEIVLTNGGSGDNRSNVSLRVFYDNETQEIIIQGDNTFDVSSLAAGSHIITITSPLGDVYEGTFTTY